MVAAGIEGTYELVDIAPDDLAGALELVRQGYYVGCNVTMPYKESVVRLLDGLDDDAGIIRAVNTVTREGSDLVGHNTDAYGVRRTVETLMAGADAGSSSAVVVGAGGTGRAATYGLIRSGFRRIVVFNRHLERAQRLVNDFAQLSTDTHLLARPLDEGALTDELRTANLLVNASSVGLNSDESPLPASILPPGIRVLDVVYSPRDTRLLRDARAAGATSTANGEPMVIHQGARAFELWFEQSAPLDAMSSALVAAMEARSRPSESTAPGL